MVRHSVLLPQAKLPHVVLATTGQVLLVPVHWTAGVIVPSLQDSAWHSVVADLTTSAGQSGLVPSQRSATSQVVSFAGRQTTVESLRVRWQPSVCEQKSNAQA